MLLSDNSMQANIVRLELHGGGMIVDVLKPILYYDPPDGCSIAA